MAKRKGSNRKGGSPSTKAETYQINHLHFVGGVFGFAVVAIAFIWKLFNSGSGGGEKLIGDDALYLLQRVQKSPSFELRNNRTLIATAFIPPQTVLMEIPRHLMIWDLDAVRNEFIRKELFQTPILGKAAKRAALLSAYLALLRGDFISPTEYVQISIAKALPSYEDYKLFHPVLASIEQMEQLLGIHSPAFRELLVFRQSLNNEYDSFIATSENFASLVSREGYLSCRLAVQSRAFQIPGILPESEISTSEQEYYSRTIKLDFRNDGVVSIEPVHDWMNSHVNNNVMVGGYDAVKRIGKAWSTKAIQQGQELINDYGRFHDSVLFGQYGYVPSDGTGTTIVTVAAYHEIGDTLPDLEEMMPYLQYDYGYRECIDEVLHPVAFRLKELKVTYLRHIAIDAARWTLPLPSRVSTDVTPPSTTRLPEGYVVPSFGEEVYEYLETHALGISLPCRLITLMEKDLDNIFDTLMQDITTLEQAATPFDTPRLELEDLQVSPAWIIRTISCMRMMARIQKERYATTIENETRGIVALARDGKSNTLEFHAAQVTLGELQSQEALEDWARDVLLSVSDIDDISPDDIAVRSEPC